MASRSDDTYNGEVEDHPGLAVLQPGETLTPIRTSRVPTTLSVTELPIPPKYPIPDTTAKREAFRKLEHTRTSFPIIDDDDDPLGHRKLERIAARLRTRDMGPSVVHNNNGCASPPPEPATDADAMIGLGLILLGVGAAFLFYHFLTKPGDASAAPPAPQPGLLQP